MNVSGHHPARLVSIIHVDGVLPSQQKYLRVTCYGAFEVTVIDGDALFRRHHVSTTDNNCRAQILRDLGTLSDGRHVVIGSSEAQRTFWDRKNILEAGLVYLDIIGALDGVQPSNLHLMGASEHTLVKLASTFGLPNYYETDILTQARGAEVRAQLAWLAYVATTLGERETRHLFTAFQAWRFLENAQPIRYLGI